MNSDILQRYCPQPPLWLFDWDRIDAEIPLIHALRDCPQDPIHHAEGNVWIHTRMVCEELIRTDAWRQLPTSDREVTFMAALLHDCGKPLASKTDENGRITTVGHAARGEQLARRYLWEAGVPFHTREHVTGIIRDHGRPLFWNSRADPKRSAIESSCRLNCSLLAMVAEADSRGRICADPQDLADRIALYRELISDLGITDQAFPFANDRSRAEYFRKEGRDPHYAAYDETWGEVVVMSGLPASGKSTLIARRFPGLEVLCLDDLRESLDVQPGESQGEVVRAAQERAKELLRKHIPFVWDATHLSRDLRSGVVNLIANYGARVRIEYVETSATALRTRNAKRSASIPADALERMLRRWDVPRTSEAESVSYTIT